MLSCTRLLPFALVSLSGCGVLYYNNRVIYELTPPAGATLAHGDNIDLGFQSVHKKDVNGLKERKYEGSLRFEVESVSPRLIDFWADVRNSGGTIYLSGKANKPIQIESDGTFIVRISLQSTTKSLRPESK